MEKPIAPKVGSMINESTEKTDRSFSEISDSPQKTNKKSLEELRKDSSKRIDRSPSEYRTALPKKEISRHPAIEKQQRMYTGNGAPLKKNSWQVHNGSYKGERDIVIGFDFGTSCTKVILQDKQLKRAFAVPFDGIADKSNRYLLPTKLFANVEGGMRLHDGKTEFDNLKVGFIQNPDQILSKSASGKSVTSQDLVSCYIGLVLLEIRKWFFKTKSLEYRYLFINWELNIGLSSRSYDDKAFFNRMKSAALTGWNLSLTYKHSISLTDLEEAENETRTQLESGSYNEEKGQLHPDNVNPIPEIIAEVTGYARSQMRHNGMYLLVDVGASTLDVSIFTLHEEENEDLYSILYAEVENLGAFVLHKYRINESKKLLKKRLRKLVSLCDGISPLPEPKEYLAPVDYNSFNEKEKAFPEKCSIITRIVIRETRVHKNPFPYEWDKGLPVFLCGGGSKLKVYGNAIKNAEIALRKTIYSVDLIEKKLPKPENLETDDIPPRDYHRMAVSYGLSFSEVDIGTIRPQRKVPDIHLQGPKIADIDSLYIDKDMV